MARFLDRAGNNLRDIRGDHDYPESDRRAHEGGKRGGIVIKTVP